MLFPLKDRTKESQLVAYDTCFNKLLATRFSPTVHILDNKCSDLVHSSISKQGVTVQKVPPTATAVTP